MSSKPEDLSPEERLLKVIQSGKAPASGPAPAAAAAAAVSVSPQPAPQAPAVEKPKLTVAPKAAEPVKPAAEKPVEKPAAKPVAKAPTPAPAAAPAAAAPISPPVEPQAQPVEKSVEESLPQPQPLKERSGGLGLRGVNRILLAAVLAGIVVVAYDLWADRPVAPAMGESDSAVVETFPQPEPVPTLAQLMAKVGDRNLFDVPDAPAPKPDQERRTDKTAAPEAAKNFKLMGVSLDERQPAESMALIRDQATGNTYFLKVGQRVADSDFVLGSIRSESVTLKTQKGELELR